MARKKQVLRASQHTGMTVIGLSCHLKYYRISYILNNVLGFNLARIHDIEMPVSPGQEMISYPMMVYHDQDMKNHYCLVSNHHPRQKLLPALRQIDYFLIAANELDEKNKKEFLGKIRSIPQIAAALEIDPAKTKDMNTLLEDIEIHLLESGKRSGNP
jgi:hypothetical protein